MHVLNVIWIFSPDGQRVLMCKRHKEPYKGLYNLPGGKAEPGESGPAAAYRELQEETGISGIELAHVMDFTYHMSRSSPGRAVRIELYCGTLPAMVCVQGDEKELVWLDVNENFFDMTRFAGEGNIGHMYEQIKLNGLCPAPGGLA